MKKITLALLTASMLCLSGCGPKINFDTSPAVIKVNNDTITKNMVDDSFKKGALASLDINRNKPQDKFIYLIYKNKIINDLIIKDLLNQEAQKRHIAITDADVNGKIKQIIDKMGGKERFEQSLKINRLDNDGFHDLIKDDLLKEKLVENFSGTNKTNENEAKDFYVKNQNKYFKHPEMVKASHILIKASENEIRAKLMSSSGKKLSKDQIDKEVNARMKEAKAKAEKLFAEVKADPDRFGVIAQKNSDNVASATKGGDLGFFTDKNMLPAFSKAAFSTKPGELTKNVVKTDLGFHIIKVIDRKKAGITPFDEVKAQIEKYLSEQNKMQSLQKMIDSSKATAKIIYVDKEYNPQQIQVEIREAMSKTGKAQGPAMNNMKQPNPSKK